MDRLNPEHEFNPNPGENEQPTFIDKFRGLLPGVEFEEPIEVLEARAAVLEALTNSSQNSDLLQSVWTEYAVLFERLVDNQSDVDPQLRARLQIAALVHKALIFREIGDIQRYGEDLSDAEEYAINMQFYEIAEAIGAELDELASPE